MSTRDESAPDRFYSPQWETYNWKWGSSIHSEGKLKNIRQIVIHAANSYDHKNKTGGFKPDDYFWFPDPDIEFAPSLPEILFATAKASGLDLCQPALTKDSLCSHEFLKEQISAKYIPRQVSFVEAMCPLFSFAALQRNLWTFDLTFSGFGVDIYAWPKNEKCYVLDWLTVKHPGPVTPPDQFMKYGFPHPHEELEAMRKRFAK